MTPTSRVMRALAVLLAALGIFTATGLVFGVATYEPTVEDFQRDIYGAAAVENGLSPYQELAVGAGLVEELPLNNDVEDLWVAHSPFSIALARVMTAILGPGGAASFAKHSFWVIAVCLTAGIVAYVWHRSTMWDAIGLAGAVWLSHGLRSDYIWVQGAVWVALGLVVVLVLNRSKYPWLALIALGVLVAWRPWLAPLALFIPGSRSRLRDVATVGLTAAIGTFLASWWLGGAHIVQDWLFVALPQNSAFYSGYEWNLSPIGPFLPWWVATALWAALALSASAMRGRLNDEVWGALGAITILLTSPLVWPQYWIGLLPLLLLFAPIPFIRTTMIALVAVSWPVSELAGRIAFVCGLSAALVIVLGLRAAGRTSVDGLGTLQVDWWQSGVKPRPYHADASEFREVVESDKIEVRVGRARNPLSVADVRADIRHGHSATNPKR